MLLAVVCGKAEICQLDDDLVVIILFTEQILWLKVTMHDAEIVHVVQSQAQLLADAGGLRL